MKTFFEEAGYAIGLGLLLLLISIGNRIDDKAAQCKQACGEHGVSSFRLVHQSGCSSDTPLCECGSPAVDGGAR